MWSIILIPVDVDKQKAVAFINELLSAALIVTKPATGGSSRQYTALPLTPEWMFLFDPVHHIAHHVSMQGTYGGSR